MEMNIIAPHNEQRSHALHFYEPITVKGLLTYSAELLDIYLDGHLQPTAKKTVGMGIGTLYRLGQDCYLGKVNYGNGFFEDDPNSIRTTTRKEVSVAAILEKIAYDVYKELGKGFFEVPASFLSLQVIQDEYHLADKKILPFAENGVESCLRILSKFPAREGYQDFGRAMTLSISRESISFVDYVHAYHKPPETLLTPDGSPVPIKGLIELLAVMRALADTDGLGGKAGNAGFVWVKDDQDRIIAAQTVKIDPGAAFTFQKRDKEQKTNFVFNEGEPGSGRWLNDLRDIQTANNDRNMNIHWQELSKDQQEFFVSTLLNCLRYKNNRGVSDLLIHRQGKFRWEDSKTEKLPKAVGNELRTALCDWLGLQEKIYAKDLRDFAIKHPDEIPRIHYIDHWGEIPLPMTDETFPVRELFTHLVLVQGNMLTDQENEVLESGLGMHDRPVSLNQLFQEHTGNPIRHVFIKGGAGVGKTVLCQEIAHEWASGRLFNEKFKAVFWIPLRILNTAVEENGLLRDINDPYLFLAKAMAELILQRPHLTEPFLQGLKTDPKQMLVLCDGYDEAKPALRQLLAPLFRNPDIHVIVTSRPGKLAHLSDSFQLVVHNAGFTPQQIEAYSHRFFTRRGNSLSISRRLKHFLTTLKDQPYLNELAKTPIRLQMLCSLWGVGDRLIGTNNNITDLYTNMVDQSIQRSQSNLKNPAINLLVHREKILYVLGLLGLIFYEKQFLAISEQSLLGLLEKHKIDLAGLVGTRLLTAIKVGEETYYEFLHQSFQEFLTALFLVRSDNRQKELFINKNGESPYNKLLFIFLANLISQNDLDQKQTHFFLNALASPLGKGIKNASYRVELLLCCLNECTDYLGEIPSLKRYLQHNPTIPIGEVPFIFWAYRMRFLHAIQWLHSHNVNVLDFVDLKYQGFLVSDDWDRKRNDKVGPHAMAAFGGSIELLEWIYTTNPALLEAENQGPNSPLYYAARGGHVAALDWLWEKAPKDALLRQSGIFHRRIIEYDNDLGISIDIKRIPAKPAQAACREGHVSVLEWLLQKDPTILQKIDDLEPKLSPWDDSGTDLMYRGSNLMHEAALGYSDDGNTEMLEYLYEMNPSFLQEKNTAGLTPLQAAIFCGALQAADWLWEKDPAPEMLQAPNSRPIFDIFIGRAIDNEECVLSRPILDWLWEKDPSVREAIKDEEFLETLVYDCHYSLLDWVYSKDPSLLTKTPDGKYVVSSNNKNWLWEKDPLVRTPQDEEYLNWDDD